MCKKPVGEGAKRVTTGVASEVALKRGFSKDADDAGDRRERH
jgi:hypothetical protein